MDKIIKKAYGRFRLEVRYTGDDYAQVTMSDVSQLRFPIIWSVGMSKAQARGAIEFFEKVGFFEVFIGEALS